MHFHVGKRVKKTKKSAFAWLGAFLPLVLLSSCGESFRFNPYSFGVLNETPFVAEQGWGYTRPDHYVSLSSADVASIGPSLSEVYSIGSKRHVLPSTGIDYLTVIPVDFPDFAVSPEVVEPIREAFFGDSSFNQFVSLSEYYDKASFHRLFVTGEVTPEVYRCSKTYAQLSTVRNMARNRGELETIYRDALTWYNASSFKTHELQQGDPIYFVYCAPYSGYLGGTTARDSMMWAFTINSIAPVAWSSYFMMHPDENGALDAHTFIHEFGHMIGLKDYYDTYSSSELSRVSPMGRMDMMDCSLGDHCSFSKLSLGWAMPYVANDTCEIRLRPSSGNGDFLLLSPSWGGSLYEEYLLLEYYQPAYLNYVDSAFHKDPAMSLMGKSGIKVYHVDARLGLFPTRDKEAVGVLEPTSVIGSQCLDYYQSNSSRGTEYLCQLLDASSNSAKLCDYYVASDHNEPLPYGNQYLALRDALFQVGQGIGNGAFADLSFHDGRPFPYAFQVKELTPTYATISITKIA